MKFILFILKLKYRSYHYNNKSPLKLQMPVTEIKSANQLQTLKKSNKPVVVAFYNNDCPFCTPIRSGNEYDNISKQFPHIKCVRIEKQAFGQIEPILSMIGLEPVQFVPFIQFLNTNQEPMRDGYNKEKLMSIMSSMRSLPQKTKSLKKKSPKKNMLRKRKASQKIKKIKTSPKKSKKSKLKRK